MVFNRKVRLKSTRFQIPDSADNKSLMLLHHSQYTEAVGRRCSVKKMFLKISQNSQENNCAKVSFLKNRL